MLAPYLVLFMVTEESHGDLEGILKSARAQRSCEERDPADQR